MTAGDSQTKALAEAFDTQASDTNTEPNVSQNTGEAQETLESGGFPNTGEVAQFQIGQLACEDGAPSETGSISSLEHDLEENISVSPHFQNVVEIEKDGDNVSSKATQVSPVLCPFCMQIINTSDTVTFLTQKGVEGIMLAAKKRKDTGFICSSGQKVHKGCRQRYIMPRLVDAAAKKRTERERSESPSLRSKKPTFDFQKNCLFCTLSATKNEKDLISCQTLEVKESLIKKCDERGDQWAEEVRGRLSSIHDLHAADALYHRQCASNFRTNKNVPAKYTAGEQASKKVKVGRPQEKDVQEAFTAVVDYLLENDDEQITVQDLVDYMESQLECDPSKAYSSVWMKKRLQDKFGEEIIFTEINGKANVATFRTRAKKILHEFYRSNTQGKDEEEEKKLLLTAAAKLIKEDIKAVETDCAHYPDMSSSDLDERLDFIPWSLQLLLSILMNSKNYGIKQAFIGQAIMQATRPKVILAPMQIQLGVQLHHTFRSKYLLEELHTLGATASYAEVQKFERNAAVFNEQSEQEYGTPFIQYAGDNIDHQLRTINGEGTIHIMGMFGAVTPWLKQTCKIPRKKVSNQEIIAAGYVQVYPCRKESKGVAKISFKKLPLNGYVDPTPFLDTIWKTSILFGKARPSWAGTMQFLHNGEHPGKASMMFLPMIDMDPNNADCINSTLYYICNHASKYQSCPIVTFDQPLYQKAVMIINNEPDESILKNVVVKMGGLHTIMSYLGSIGYIMSNSGLEEALETVYAKNSIQHMMSGKIIYRAIRGHFLVDAVLNGILLSRELGHPLDSLMEGGGLDDEDPSHSLYTDLHLIYQKMMETQDMKELEQSELPDKIQKMIEAQKNSLQDSRTAKLWISYMQMIDILKRYLKAERLGDWNLHLQATADMLPYFAASGHNNYLKSSYIYLQQMYELPNSHPSVHHNFSKGLFVVRRSNRQWAGIPMDQIIEQCLMQNLKTSGGLTHGGGFSEIERHVWTLSMPTCVALHQSMQKLTSTNQRNREQNQEMGPSRISRDWKDTKDIATFFDGRDPFAYGPVLCNIANGVNAHPAVNVENAKILGDDIVQKMVGHEVTSFSFKRKDQAITLASKGSLKVDGESIQVDTQLLFQRLVLAAKTNLENALEYELCTVPKALFEAPELLHEAQKSTLADAI